MLTHMTCGRYDNREWPPFLGLIDVPQWEAEHLIGGGNAEYPDNVLLNRGFDVLKVADVNYEATLKPVDYVEDDDDPRYVRKTHLVPVEENDDDYDSDFDRDDYDSDFDRAPEVKRPYSNANKAEWIDYVVERGLATQSEAKNLTKAALMELDS